jgi:hypothetical protein
MNPVHPALLFLISTVPLSVAGTAIETAFLKSLKTPTLGTTADDWIALLGEPVKKVQKFGQPVDAKHPTVNDKNLDLIFDHGDVQIWASSFAGIVSSVVFTAKDQKTSKTGFTWDENNIWTVLEQYGIQRFALEEDHWYPGEKRGSHGDFTIRLTLPNLARHHNNADEFGSLGLESNSMEQAETKAKEDIASSFIPDGLKAQFDMVFNPVFESNNWMVKGTVKNNSNVAVNRTFLRALIYVFDDKKRLLAVYPTAIEPSEPEVFNPGEEFKFFTIFSDPDNKAKSFGAGLEIRPYAIPAK